MAMHCEGQVMDSKWQEQLLALVARYGEACAQMAAERVSGRSEHPPANRSGAWAAVVSHVAGAAPHSAAAQLASGTNR
jgi:hypothetical protein